MTKESAMKKIRKGTQLKLTNPKRAGRTAIHSKGIRHRKREEISRPRPLHLTIKLNRADIQNKTVLKILRNAIQRARLRGLKIIHYSLEHDHVHLFAEGESNLILSKGMQGLGVSLSKRINNALKIKGQRYKTRYHLRVLKSATEVKNVINYILKNGIKHKRCKTVINAFNSAIVLHEWRIVGIKMKRAEIENALRPFQRERDKLEDLLDKLILYKKELRFTFD
jgi:REP element-mobilizing transposase RayT